MSNCILLKFMYPKFELYYSIKQWIYRYRNMGHLLKITLYFLGFCVLSGPMFSFSEHPQFLPDKRWEGDFRNTCSFDEVTQQYIDVVNMCNSLSTFFSPNKLKSNIKKNQSESWGGKMMLIKPLWLDEIKNVLQAHYNFR